MATVKIDSISFFAAGKEGKKSIYACTIDFLVQIILLISYDDATRFTRFFSPVNPLHRRSTKAGGCNID